MIVSHIKLITFAGYVYDSDKFPSPLLGEGGRLGGGGGVRGGTLLLIGTSGSVNDVMRFESLESICFFCVW